MVTGTDDGDNLQNLHKVLARLEDTSLKLKLEKCVSLAPSIEYLGPVISQAALAPPPRKVDAVLKAPKPQNNMELQRYFGLINFYRKQRSSQLDKQGLAHIFRVERFHQCLWRRKFEAVADHKPLLWLLGSHKAVPVQASPRVVPDAVQGSAEVFMLEHAYQQHAHSHQAAELSLQERCLLVLQSLHAGDPGVEKTKMVARSHVWTLVPPIRGFWGPLKGHFFLVLVDALSNWMEVLPVTTPSAGVTIGAPQLVFDAQALLVIIVSANGPAFVSIDYLVWLTKNGMRRMGVPPLPPCFIRCS
ncbi:uncharacterized protein LOC142588586 [Dermacentor variabilis]|uniref:uncharacterized protein LOC142588586 n=1 Tax=Dermacentor variabilis TaxID=34621 RepID=UPI003F5B525F